MIQDKLGAYAATLETRPLSAEVLAGAKRVIVDTLAVTVRGGVLPPATLLQEALAEELDHGSARLLPDGRFAPARTAALINGTAAHTIEFDDIFRDAIYHPGTVVIPAVLAAAEAAGASGEQVLRGVIAGYEVSNRIGRAVNPAHYTYWHTTGTVGHFGAAIGAGVALGLTAEQLAHALATAGTMAAGLQQAFRADAMSKPLHAGQAAANGLLVAMGAARGITGAAQILEGPLGFGRAMSGDVDWDTAFTDLEDEFTILRTTQKNHTCCGHTHAAVDAVIELVAENGLKSEEIKAIKVGTYATAIEVTGNADPQSEFEAKFSLPYCAAVAAVTGRCRFDAFTQERRRDDRVRDLMGRVSLSVDPEADGAFPRKRGAMVRITMQDGQTVEQRNPTRKGDPDRPLSAAEITDKWWECVEPLLGRQIGGELLDALWNLETIDNLGRLPMRPNQARDAAE